MNCEYYDTLIKSFKTRLKRSFSVPKIYPKSTQMYILYTNLSFYIIFTMFHYIGQG